MVDVSARFRYDGNFGPLQAQIKALTRDISVLNASFVSMDKAALASKRAMADSFAANITATGRYKATFVDLTSATEEFGRSLEKGKLSLRQYWNEARKAYRQDSMTRRLAERQVRMLQSQVVDVGDMGGGRRRGIVVTPLKLDTSDFNTKMQLATQQYAIFNKLVGDGANQLINWGKNTQWAGRQLTVGLTVPLTIFGAMVSKTFREVDAELVRFAKVYGSDLVSANGAATEKMKAQVRDLAIEYSRTYGIAAKETIALAADIAATGKEGDVLLGSVQQTTRLAVLGEVDRQEAMKTTLAIQSAFNQNTKELSDTINFLNAVENQTSTSLQDFTAAIPKAGPVVRQLGGDIKDLALMLTAMREGGIPAAEAANAIKSGLSALINPTKAATERLGALGVDIEGIVQKNRGELMPTLMEFSSVINQLDQFSRAKVIEELFGRYQFARISALFDNINKSGSQTAQVMEIIGLSSADLAKAANQEINELTDSISTRFVRAVESLKSALLPIGEVLTSAVIPFIEGTATAVGKVVEVFNNLPGPIKNGLKLLLGMTAVAGPIIMLAGVFGNFLGYMTKGILGLTNFSRKLMGLPTQKLEILDEQSIAAARATDILTESFEREAVTLQALNRQLLNYQANLRRTAAASPQLFVPGSPARPIRRSTGGDIPGYGGGDKVPALLEPGEFVVRKEVANKNRGFLRSLNSGSVKGFNDGGAVQGDSGLARSHVVTEYFGEGDSRRKIFGGLVSIENQGYNQAIEQLGDIFPENKQPITFSEFERSRRMLREKFDGMVARGEQIPRYISDAMDSMDSDYNQYTRSGIQNAPRKFREELAKRMAMGTITTLPRFLSNQKDAIFDAERDRILRILDSADDPELIRREMVRSARSTSYASGRRSRLLSDILGAKGSEKFGKSTRSLVLGLYGSQGRGAPTLPTSLAQEFLQQKGISSYSPGFRAGLPMEQAAPAAGTPASQRRPSTSRPGTIVNLEPGEVAVTRDSYRDRGAFIDSQGRVYPNVGPVGGARSPRMPFFPFLDEGGTGRGSRVGPNWEQDAGTGLFLPPSRETRTSRPQVGIEDLFDDYMDDQYDDRNKNRRMAGRGGSALMNVGFAGTMLAGMASMNGEMSNATSALTAFSAALMVAGTAIEMSSMFGGGLGGGLDAISGKGRGGFLGMRSAGGAMQRGGARLASRAGPGIMGRIAGVAGPGLISGGQMVSMLGGPIGMGLAAILAAIGAAAYQVNNILHNMRKSAESAFVEPTEMAKYFGIELGRTAERAQELLSAAERLGYQTVSTADMIDEDFVQKVGTDYEDLINRLSGQGEEVGKELMDGLERINLNEALERNAYGAADQVANDLKLAYSAMIARGFGKDEAMMIVEEIARQAGQQTIFLDIEADLRMLGDDPEKNAKALVEGTKKSIEIARSIVNKNMVSEMQGSARGAVIDFGLGVGPQAMLELVNNPDVLLDFAGAWDSITGYFERMVDPTKRFTEEYQAALATATNSGEVFGASFQTLLDMFKQAPSETEPAIDQLLAYASGLDAENRRVFGDKIFETVEEDLGAVTRIYMEGLGNETEDLDKKLKIAQASGLGLAMAIEQIIMAEGSITTEQIDELIQSTIALVKLNDEFDESLQEGIDALKQQSKEINKDYNQRIKLKKQDIRGLQKEAEIAQENHDAYMRNLEDQSRALAKKADAIREEAEQQQKLIDKQIKSLDVAKEEDDFRKQQGQRALGLLSALASGDMQSYFGARDDYFQAQDDRMHDLAVQALQDRKEQIQEEADAKLKAIEKEQQALDDARYAAQRAHEEFMKQNREEIEGIEKTIGKLERKRNKIMNNIEARVKLLQTARDQESLTEGQIIELETELDRLGLQLPEKVVNTLKGITDGLFGPNGEYQRLVTTIVRDIATALGISEEEAKKLLGNAVFALPSYGGDGGGPGGGVDSNTSTPQATGGYISGPGTATSDSIPARLSNGEYVIRASSVRKYGVGALDAINEGRFAEGGYVDAAARRAMVQGKIPYPKPAPATAGTGIINYNNPQNYDYNTVKSDPVADGIVNSIKQGFAAALSFLGMGGVRTLASTRPTASGLTSNESAQFSLPAWAMGVTPEQYSDQFARTRAMDASLFAAEFMPFGAIAGGVIKSTRLASMASRVGKKNKKRGVNAKYNNMTPEEYDLELRNILLNSNNPLPPGVRSIPIGITDPAEIQAYNNWLGILYKNNPDIQRNVFWTRRKEDDVMIPGVKELLDLGDSGYIFGSNPAIDNTVRGLMGSQNIPVGKKITGLGSVIRDQKLPTGKTGALGIDYRMENKTINTGVTFADLIETSAHEAGHAIDDILGVTSDAKWWNRKGKEAFTSDVGKTFVKRNLLQGQYPQGVAEAAAEANRIAMIGQLISSGGFKQSPKTVVPYIRGKTPMLNRAAYGDSPRFKAAFLLGSARHAFQKSSPFYWGNQLSARQKLLRLGAIGGDFARTIPKYPSITVPGVFGGLGYLAFADPFNKNGMYPSPIQYPEPSMRMEDVDLNSMRTTGFNEGGLVGVPLSAMNILSIAALENLRNTVLGIPSPGQTGQPGTPPMDGTGGIGLFGSPTTPGSTSTSLISHPSQGGPNRWPYFGYRSATGIIPGVGKALSMNADVLPLFLAFASEYHNLIRPIGTIYGIGSRDGNYSNHPSGTAVDINPGEEGQYFGWGQSLAQKQAVLNWWRGNKSPLANWDSRAAVPYQAINSLIRKYKVLQWFGPQSLGGYIIDEMGNSDPMHVQITQSRTVTPQEVAGVISSLGINPDGTFNRPFNYAKGGSVLGTSTSDSIMARVSRGEYVMNASAVNYHGVKFMDAINSGQIPGFRNGGFVGPQYSMPSGTRLNAKTFKSVGTDPNIEYNINVNVASSNATPEEIVNKTMRALNSRERSRRMSINA